MTNESSSGATFAETFALWLPRVRELRRRERYCHHHLSECEAVWPDVGDRVCEYFRRAHNDAVGRILRLVGPTLHPTGAHPAAPNGYPHGLPDVTLQGFFGEVLAGMCAEYGLPNGYADWEIPVFLFRTHLVAFQQLEREAQTHDMPGSVPGRTGDDCLAFRRDAEKNIIAVLYCEAKCTLDHDAGLIADAHQKAADSPIVDLLQIIEVLLERGTSEASTWVDGLRLLRDKLMDNPASVVRHDAVVYVYQREPIQNPTWISMDGPHANYGATRTLDTYEIRLPDVRSRINAVYAAAVWR